MREIYIIDGEKELECELQKRFARDKMFKFKLDKLLLASNVCIGEPTTAIAMSIA